MGSLSASPAAGVDLHDIPSGTFPQSQLLYLVLRVFPRHSPAPPLHSTGCGHQSVLWRGATVLGTIGRLWRQLPVGTHVPSPGDGTQGWFSVSNSLRQSGGARMPIGERGVFPRRAGPDSRAVPRHVPAGDRARGSSRKRLVTPGGEFTDRARWDPVPMNRKGLM